MQKTFSDVCADITRQATKIPQSQYLSSGKYKIFDQGKEYIGGYSDNEEGVIKDAPFIVFGDHTRVIKYVDEACYIGADGVKLLKVIDENFIPKYVYYSLLARPIANVGYSRHFKFLKELLFSVVDKQIQKKRVMQLDEISNCIDIKSKQLIELDELIKSRFVEMFADVSVNDKNWVTQVLSSLGTLKNGMNFHYDDKGVSVRVLGVGDFKDNSVINNAENLSLVTLAETPAADYYLQNHDLIFVRSNGNKALVGRCVEALPNDVPTVFSGFCIRFRCESDAVKIKYLLYFFKQDEIRAKIAGRGANIQNLNQKILSAIDVPLPPLELQNRFAEFVQKTEQAKTIVKQQIADLQELLDSKMEEYFG